METEKRYERSLKIRKTLMALIIGFIVLSSIFAFIRMPVKMAGWFVPFSVETLGYIPIDVDSEYSKVVGFNKVKMVYENQEGTITVWATTKIGWFNVSKWEEVKLTGGYAYYDEGDNSQVISFRIGDVEYGIEYKGDTPLAKEEVIKMADSIKITQFASE